MNWLYYDVSTYFYYFLLSSWIWIRNREKQFLTNIHVSLKFSDYNRLHLWSVVCFWMNWNDVIQGVHLQNIPNADVKKSLQKGMLILNSHKMPFAFHRWVINQNQENSSKPHIPNHTKTSKTDMTGLWISLFHIFYIWYLKTNATMPVYYVKL